MKRAFLGALAAMCLLTLGACANLQSAYNAVTTSQVSPKLVIIAANAFDAVEVSATGYVRYCTPTPQPAGCSDTAIRQIIPAVRSGRTARDGLKAFLVAHPDQLGPSGLYDALTASTATLKTILDQYSTKG